MHQLHRRFRAICAAISALLVAGLLAAPSALSVTVFEPSFPVPPAGPTTLTASGVTSDTPPVTDVAVNAQGDAVAVWTVYKHGPLKNDDGPQEFQAAFRSGVAGTWSAPETILSGGPKARTAKVGIDASGVATIAWTEYGPGIPSVRVRAVTHSASGFTVTQTVASPTDIWELDLAVAPSGRAVLTYLVPKAIDLGSYNANGASVQVAQRSTSSGDFGAPQTVSSAASNVAAGDPDAAINAQGRAAVTWSETVLTETLLDDEDTRVRLAAAPAGGPFGAPIDLSDRSASPARTEWNARVVVEPSGSAVVTWNEGPLSSPTDSSPYEISARRIALDTGSKGARQVLQTGVSRDSAARDGSDVRLASDAAGRVTATWTTAWDVGRLTSGPIYVATAEPGLGFGAPLVLADDARGAQPVLAVDAGGTTAVSWAGYAAPITVAWRPAGASAFSLRLKPADAWATSIAAAFSEGAHLTLLFARDLAPGYTVQTTTSMWATAIADGPVPAPTPDTTKPVVSVKGVSVVKVPRAKGKQRKSRLVATLAASEDVSVRVVVSQARRGIVRGGVCVKRPASPMKRKGRKACTRTVVIGPEVGAPVGAKGAALDLGAAPPKGKYTLTVKGRDGAGNAGDPVTFPFTVR